LIAEGTAVARWYCPAPRSLAGIFGFICVLLKIGSRAFLILFCPQLLLAGFVL